MSVQVDEAAITNVLACREFAALGESRIRLVATAYEQLYQGQDLTRRDWSNTLLRKELWRLLGPQIEDASETLIWMALRRYRDVKRKAIFDARQEEARRKEEAEKAAALARKKAAAEAAKKKKAEAEAAKKKAEEESAAGDGSSEDSEEPGKKAGAAS